MGTDPQEIMRVVALFDAGRYPEVEAGARQLLASAPRLALAWQLLALALGRQDKDALDAWIRAVDCAPDDAAARNNLGNAYARLGRLDEAAACFRVAIRLQPVLAEAHAHLGLTLAGLARDAEAIASLQRARALAPGTLQSCLHLAALLRRNGQLEAAATAYGEALALDPRSVAAWTGIATVLRLQRNSALADEACAKALALDPRSTAALAIRAELRADLGDFAAAEALYRQVISIDPRSVPAWSGLVQLRRMTERDGDWLTGARRLAGSDLAPDQELHLQHALGKYYDDTGAYDLAFGSHQRANELARRCGPGHDRDGLAREIDRLRRSLDSAWLSRMQGAGRPSSRPLLIVGMLRSGTTLAEQMLAAHGAVQGAGELSFWGQAWSRLAATAGAAASPTVEVGAPALQALADGYLARLDGLAAGAERVVDKMPTNFLVLGLITAALPGARFIHLRRDARDTCLSIYFQHFEAANTWTNDLGDLAHYMLQYRRLMDHWRSLLPAGVMLEVDYEDLVSDPEGCARRMVAFAGLDWDPRCLHFQGNAHSVVTASRWQVRQPVHRGAIGRWRHYEKFIAPLRVLVDPPTG